MYSNHQEPTGPGCAQCLVSLALAACGAFLLPGCVFTTDRGKTRTEAREKAISEIAESTSTTRRITLEGEPLADPELDPLPPTATASVTMPGVEATVPAGRFKITVDETEGTTTESTTTTESDVHSVIEQAKRVPVQIYVAGFALVVAGAAVAIWLKKFWWGLGLAGSGILGVASVVAFVAYPWISIVLVAFLLVGVVLLFFHLRAGDDKDATLIALVRSIEDAPQSSKTHIVQEMGNPRKRDRKERATIKRIIGEVKRREGMA